MSNLERFDLSYYPENTSECVCHLCRGVSYYFFILDTMLCCIHCRTPINYLWHSVTDAAIVFLVFAYSNGLRMPT